MVKINQLEIGKGIPKICVPIVEGTQDAILEMGQKIAEKRVDLVEWRIDFYQEVHNQDKLEETASLLKSILRNIPLLVTFRTAKEGGEQDISWEKYASLLLKLAQNGNVDIIDIEMFRGYDSQTAENKKEYDINTISKEDQQNEKVRKLIRDLQQSVTVIGSYHDFEKTPSKEEIVKRLLFMNEMGADIPKIAVMPQSEEDVLELMQATLQAKRTLQEIPIITMSMGKLGLTTRLAGELTGSAVTFGCLGKPSAPGQIQIEQLQEYLKGLH